MKIIKIAICSILTFTLLTNCADCIKGIGRNDLADVLDAWEKEADPDIAIFDGINTVIFKGNRIYLDEAVKDHYENAWNDLLLCVKNNKIYGIHSYNYKQSEYGYTVDIYSIDITTNSFEVLYTDNFGVDESGGAKYYLSYKSVYYQDGTIVMCDGLRGVSYSIDTGDAEEFDSADFSMPKKEYSIETVFGEAEEIEIHGNRSDISGEPIDHKAIKIVAESEERVITVDYMAQRHPYVKELVNMGVFRNPLGEVDPLERFFCASDVYVINEKIYLVCRVLDYDGESSGLIFSYDFETDQFTYIDYVFSIDVPELVIMPAE